MSRIDCFLDQGGQIRADGWQRSKVCLVRHEAGHGFAVAPDRTGAIAIRADPEWVGIVKRKERGDFLQHVRDFGIGDHNRQSSVMANVAD